MKSILRKISLLLTLSCTFAFASQAIVVNYYFYFKGVYTSYQRVAYTKSETATEINHTLSCSDPGQNSCCWPITPKITKGDYSFSYDDIKGYVMAQVQQQVLHGSILYGNMVPVSRSVNSQGVRVITVESD
jgi:hypothetical protein